MPLSFLLVGFGDIAQKRVLPAILSNPQARLSAIVTRDSAKNADHPSYRTLEEALAQSEAEAVYVATPVFLHAAQTIAALRAGRHVLCEKPMALNYSDAEAMHQTAVAAKRTLAIAYYRRTYPKVERARQLIAAGSIGRPVVAEAACHDWVHPTGEFRSWLIDPEQAGGGPLYDIACHRIDLMNYLFGAPLKTTGQLSTLVHPTRVEDNATILTEHDSGVRSIVDARWHSKVVRDEFRIRGTEGELDLTPLNSPVLTHPGGTELFPTHPNIHYPLIDDFVSAVLENRPPICSSASALHTDWVLNSAAR